MVAECYGWTFDEIRRMTVRDFNAAMRFRNELKEAKGKRKH